MQGKWPFDSETTQGYTNIRQEFARQFLADVRKQEELDSAADIGCGVGYFSKFLSELGFRVLAVDGRRENVEEATRRHPGIKFIARNVEDESFSQIGTFDFVLCVGLLYHLENPFRAIRNLHSVTGKVLLLETMCVPGRDPGLQLLDEPEVADQALNYVAFYPNEPCVVKMLYRAGFPFVYRFKILPRDDQFRMTLGRKRSRTILLGSKVELAVPNVILEREPVRTTIGPENPWITAFSRIQALAGPSRGAAKTRIGRFLRKPWREKANSIHARWVRLIEPVRRIKLPVRLPSGLLWFPRDDNVGEPLLAGAFEISERAFVERFVQPGMNVLDLGAHHGLYTLIASKRVGSRGGVIAFEPSPRERRALRLHLLLNLCTNVAVQGFALGNEEGKRDLFVVNGDQTGCNSLRPPDVYSGTSRLPVQVTRLDSWLERRRVGAVHFIKLDVEGAELDVLKGAERLLERRPRPVILAEVQQVRTQPWGYRAVEIIRFLSEKGFRWFSLGESGSLHDMPADTAAWDGNFVAWPEEVQSGPRTGNGWSPGDDRR